MNESALIVAARQHVEKAFQLYRADGCSPDAAAVLITAVAAGLVAKQEDG